MPKVTELGIRGFCEAEEEVVVSRGLNFAG